MRCHDGIVTALVGLSDSLQRRRRWTSLDSWYIDIFRHAIEVPMKTLLIAGASSGIGKATAVEAAQQDWRVVACGRTQARLDELQTPR
jgi:phosphoglycerate dehydrogenase-like enzyme